MRSIRRARTALSKFVSLTVILLIVAGMALSTAVLPGAKPVLAASPAVSIQRVSVPSNSEADRKSCQPSISADGRYVAFQSDAENLVDGDYLGFSDIFVRDRQTGETTRVSVGTGNIQGDGNSYNASISADGRYVAFDSSATNLVAGDTNGTWDVFVHDRQTGETTRVSAGTGNIQSDGDSHLASISADGRYVTFESDATNLVAGDTNWRRDIFVHDRQTGETTRVSVGTGNIQGDGISCSAGISADGRYVAFESSATNLVVGDTNGTWDVFVHDRQTGETTRVSVDSTGAQGNSSSYSVSISADGRYVAFQSVASNLVAGDTNGYYDVFVHDRQTGETTRVSVGTGNIQSNGYSLVTSISADGRYVAFESNASNLVAGDTNGYYDVFVHDRQTGETTRVSVHSDGAQGDSDSYNPSISADGRYVAFDSWAADLVANDINNWQDVFVHDRQTGETTRASVGTGNIQSNGHSFNASISEDGRYVAFESYAANLVAGDTNGTWDVFVRDRQTGETTRVSVHSDGAQGDSDSYNPSISADGRYVAFMSYASNLVAGDTNGTWDVFVHDRQTGKTTRVSVGTGNIQSDGISYNVGISADGRYVAFDSWATNLVANDTNGKRDVFVHDRQTGETTRVSVGTGNIQSDDTSWGTSISEDGRYVAFESDATNLVDNDTNGKRDIFVHDRQTAETTRVSVGTGNIQSNDGSYYPSITKDGRHVAFESYATNLVADDTNGMSDIFVHDRQTGGTTRVSVDSYGGQSDSNSSSPSVSEDRRYVAFVSWASNLVSGDTNWRGDVFFHDWETGETTRVSVSTDNVQGDDGSCYPSITKDGRYVAFESDATNLVAGDTNGVSDIFVHDRQTGETTRVSMPSNSAQSYSDSSNASISADGRYVAFQSYATNLVAGDTNGVSDIFVHDRQTRETTRVSVGTGNTQSNSGSYNASISADGRYVAFESDANLVSGDTNGTRDIFVHDRQTAETTRVSVDSTGVQSNGCSYVASISADGQYVAFYSSATNLVAGDTNGVSDIFVHDRQAGLTARVSVGTGNIQSDGCSYVARISADGRYVAFESHATNLVAGDTNGTWDVFVHDRQTGETTRLSVDSTGAQSNGVSMNPSISADGRYVAFESDANLVSGDTNGTRDIFVHDRQTGETTRVSVDSYGAQSNDNSWGTSISEDGRYVAFVSPATNLVAGDTNGVTDVFIHDRQTGWTTRASETTGNIQSDGISYNAGISADGRYVAFESYAANLVSGDTNGVMDIFVASWRNPALDYAPASIDFGSQYQGSTTNRTLQVRNTGTGTLSYNLSENSTWCSISPGSGDSSGETDNLSVNIDTSGLSPGQYSCVVLIPSDGGLGVVPVYLTVLPAPVIVVAPTSYDFGAVVEGSAAEQVFTVSNSGSENLTIGTVGGANPLAAPFSIVSDNCSGQTLLPGENCTLTVRFSPTTKGSFTDSFDIPSNDPSTPVVTVTLTGSSPNRAPTAPVVDVTPNNPTTTADLVCSITTESTDADSDNVTYTYQWYKDGVLQSGLTTNKVGAAETARGQVWKCVVNPSDGTTNGPSAEDQVTIGNAAPAAPVVAITPDSPSTAADLVCGVTTESTDADGDAVTYTYQWYKDGVLQSGLTTNTVPAAETSKGQAWRCVFTPNDGTTNGPSAEAQVTIGNTAPTAPIASVTPESPDGAADLVCSITTESTDADGDTITYTYQWYKDGVLQSDLNTNTVPAAKTAKGEVWKCVVTPNDGTTNGPSAEAQVTIGNTAPTAPIASVTPESPDGAADLVCTITTESTDADGDTITYTYQWYKDGVLQSDLNTNTVPAAKTAKGEVWKCVVTASDGTASAPAEAEVTVSGAAAGFPSGAIAGIVIGILAVAGAAAFFWFRRSKKGL